MKGLLREPLLHFLLVGAFLFLMAGLRHRSAPTQLGSSQPQSQKIVITQGDVESLIAGFTNLWHRPPTAQELDGLIQGRVREEVYYREALKMGLDRDDTIIRGRLQEKLEFLSQDVNKLAEPTEQDLKSFLAANPEKFRSDARFTFRLVFVDAGRHGAATVPYAQSLLAALQKNPGLDAATMGDPLPFHRAYERVTKGEVAKQFGSQFGAALSTLKVRQWSGPVKSEDGAYIVYLVEEIPGQLPPLDEVRPKVRKEWLAAQRAHANDKFYQNLLRGYTVNVELSPAARAQAGTETPSR
jgi:PPIC-type PPIASE domain